MTKNHLYKTIYWIVVSVLIAFLLINSFKGFWNSWLVALLFLIAVLFVKYGIKKVQSFSKTKKYLRYFLLAVGSLYWVYLSITLAYWYILELKAYQLEQILINPIFIWIIIGFFVGLEYFLFKYKEKPVLEKVKIYSNRKKTILVIDELAYIESRGDFTIAVLIDGSEFKNLINISTWENRLDRFLRVHRSFLVNPDKSILQGNEVVVNGKWKIPISRSYKERVVTYFNNL